MKSLVGIAGSLALVALSSGTALAQEAPNVVWQTAPVVAPAAQNVVVEAPPAAPVTVQVEAAPPPVAQIPPGTVVARGQWVSTAENGWIWVPENAETYSVNQVPYVYLYTPTYGWTWYTSPWGPGRYSYGAWAGRPWNNGFRAWSHSPAGWGWSYAPRATVRIAPRVVARPAVRVGGFYGGHVGGYYGGHAGVRVGGHFGGHGRR